MGGGYLHDGGRILPSVSRGRWRANIKPIRKRNLDLRRKDMVAAIANDDIANPARPRKTI